MVVALAAWRTWHLLALDDILDRPRRYVTRLGDWREDGDTVPADYRQGIAEFLECPYCFGAWIACAWVVAWAVWPEGTWWAALPFAVSAAVIAVAHWLSSE